MKTPAWFFTASLGLLAALLAGAWFWFSGRTVDVHAELRRSLIESRTTQATAQRSTHMIRQLAAYRSEAVASGTGVALNVLGPVPNPERLP